jgi:hypothetical protein
MGEQIDHVSASVSALVLKGLNKESAAFCTAANNYWQWLQNPDIHNSNFAELPVNAQQLLHAFSFAQGSYSGVKPLLGKLMPPANCNKEQVKLLKSASAAGNDLSELARQFNLPGKKTVVPALRAICRLYFAENHHT